MTPRLRAARRLRPGAGRPRGAVAARVVWAACAAVAAAAGCAGPDPAQDPPPLGEPVAGLDRGQRASFLLGRALFERLATPDEGLGPLYNADRCSDCHDQPVVGGAGTRLRVLKATRFEDGRCDLLREHGGDNIQRRATDALAAHGMGPEEVPAAATATALVTAPPLFGLGLIEAVPDETLAEWEDPDDRDGDGISGRLPRLPDGRAARFGRKGDAAAVRDFVDSALRFELGFTTPDHPVEEAVNGAPVPPGADPMPDPEIDAAALGHLAAYARFLAPPPPAQPPTPAARDAIAQGRALFAQIGCGACHREEMATAADPALPPPLARRAIRPYSDFLLHDLGPDLADVCGPDAAPAELRTAPLWGLRHRARLLHDGRAANSEAAISHHGGEAAAARAAFLALPEAARRALLRFLESL